MRSLLLTLLALMLLVPSVALASDTSLLPEEEPIIEVIPFGEDPQTVSERLHAKGLHEHPEPEARPILKKKETDPRFQLYYPGDDKRVGLKIKIRLWTFEADDSGVVKKFYIKPKISEEPRLMFTFKF